MGMNHMTSCEYILGEIHCVIKSFMPERVYDNTARARYSECFVYVLSGSAEYTFGDRKLVASKGEVLYLAKGSRYSIKVNPGYRFIYVDFDICSEDSGKLSSFIYKVDSEKARELFGKLHFCWTKELKYKKSKCRAVLYSVYSLLFECESGKETGQLGIIEPALRLVAEKYADPSLSVELLAKACGISCVHLRRVFAKHFGMSPIKYILQYKMTRAKELLKYDMLSVTEISEMLGYSGIFYFSKSFKKENGMTPGEYRKLYRH